MWKSKGLFSCLESFLLLQPFQIQKTFSAPLSSSQCSPSPLVFCDLNFPWKCPEPWQDVLPCPVPVLEGTHSAPWPLAKNCEWPVIPGRSLWLCCVGCYYTHPASACLELNMYKAVCRILCPPENFNECLSLEWGQELKYSEPGSPGNQHFKFSFPLLGLNLS